MLVYRYVSKLPPPPLFYYFTPSTSPTTSTYPNTFPTFYKTPTRPKGDFIITHHPSYAGLFLATGGSGHGFKFLPVLGEKIVDAIQGRLDPELQELWAWPGYSSATAAAADDDDGTTATIVWTEDGSRSGAKGLILMDELAKGGKGEKLKGSKL